jgi:hypothetical protein
MDDIRDTQKDIQKHDPLSRFFDKQTIRTNPFGANQSGDLAYRRAERIVAALYLVTNHISPEELLRTQIRIEALRILEQILAARNEMRGADSIKISSCRTSIRYIISLVRMLTVSGLLSLQNGTVVVEGLDDLGSLLANSSNAALSESVVLSRESLTDIHGGIVKDVRDTREVKDRSIKDASNMSDKTTFSGELDSREKGIIGVLRVGGELGIKDISSNLPEYSEKMIQRDLAKLVAAGRVKKIGLKRWSRYSIAL